MITEITRGHIRLQIADKTVTVQGEAYHRGFGSPDFVAYKDSIQRWDPPFEALPMDQNTKDLVMAHLVAEMSNRGMTIELE